MKKGYCSCPRPKDFKCPENCEKAEAYKIVRYKILGERDIVRMGYPE